MRRSLAFDTLENIESLSAIHPHRPTHRKPTAHVMPHADKLPHQYDRQTWTGTRITGEIALDPSNARPSGNTLIVASGTLMIGRTKVDAVVAISTHDQRGSLAIQVGNDMIYADVVTLPDGTWGNYTITQANGRFQGVTGTGVFRVTDSGLAFNAHQL